MKTRHSAVDEDSCIVGMHKAGAEGVEIAAKSVKKFSNHIVHALVTNCSALYVSASIVGRLYVRQVLTPKLSH